MTLHVLRQRLACLFLLALSLFFAPYAQAATHSARLPNQEYREVHEDLAVKVLGGHIRITRTWEGGRWYLNPAWASLRFVPDALGGVRAIWRASVLYKRIEGQRLQRQGANPPPHQSEAAAACACCHPH